MNEHQDAGEAAALPCQKIVRGQKQLTAEQEEYVWQFVQERIAAMLSTATIDEAEAEEHLRGAYRAAGLEPVPVRWFDSPLSFVLTRYPPSEWDVLRGDVLLNVRPLGISEWDRVMYKMTDSLWHSIRDIMRDSVKESVEDSIDNSVWDNVWGSIAGSVADDVRDYVRDRLRSSVDDGVWDSVWESVRVQVGEEVWASMGENMLFSMGDSVEVSLMAYAREGRFAYLRFFHELFEANDFIHLARFNEMVSGYQLGSKEAWVVRKPIRLERDEQSHFHSEQDKCLEYPDGWGFYAWHGVRVPEKIILRSEQITREDWLGERNQEVRHVIAERLGNDRFVELVGATCVDQGQRGTLVEVDLGNDPERVARFVRVQDSSTERQYYLRVPPSMQTADEAVAWTFGLAEADYQPQQQA